MTIGRDAECDICIPDHRISRKHAKLSVMPSGVLVEDLGSVNGTIVNGKKIDKPTLFESGALIKFHNMEFAIINISPKTTETFFLRSNHRDDIELHGLLSVGRDAACDLCIPDHRISRRHAKMTVTLSGVLVEDLNSINGTYVNDQRISQPTLLKAGDRVRFHEQEFRVDKALDPNATIICVKEVDADATICAGVIVKSPQTKAIAPDEASDEPSNSIPSRPAIAEPENSTPEAVDQNKLSAIQRQLRKGRPQPECQVEQLTVGMWVEFKNMAGKNNLYYLVSIAGSGDQTYCFVRKRGFSLIKKELKEVAAGLNSGSLRIIEDAPVLASAFAQIKSSLIRKR